MTVASACPACTAAPLAEDIACAPSTADIYLSLPTIHCAACIGKVERALAALPGVDTARVNLSLKRVAITAPGLKTDRAVAALSDIGFPAYPLDPSILLENYDATGRALLTRLAVAGFAMMNVMLLSVSVWSGATDATRDLFHLISAAIALPVVSYAGQPFFINAWRALKARSLNMDVPISLAIILAAGMSLYETLNSGQHAYFDAALSLTFFLLIGRYLDHKTRSNARSAAKELSALEIQTAYREQESRIEEVPLADLAVGDVVLIPTGARVPVDGALLGPRAITDRSFLTGESAAINVASGDKVQAGEINLGDPFRLHATAVGEDTTLRRVTALVEMAENSRNSYTALADRAAQIYAPAVHLLALVAFVLWIWVDGDIRHALNVAIAVLIITCPCALGLAVPAVATAAIGKLYGMGLLVKSGSALERLAEVDTVVFDKTGTLSIPGVAASVEALNPQQKSTLRALAQASDHPVSRAIVSALQDQAAAPVGAIVEHAGNGVEGMLNGVQVRLGKGLWMGTDYADLALQIGDAAPIKLPVSETLRPGATAAVDEFRKAGLDVYLISGDSHRAVDKLASSLNLNKSYAAVSAEDKHSMLMQMAAEGHKVLMVGDGLNDTAALAAAHAAVAPSTALDASRNAADIVLLRDGLESLPRLHRIACSATHLSRMNFGIAAAYNFIAIPVAFLGFATPLLAALAMSTSSVTVLLNALRVRNVK